MTSSLSKSTLQRLLDLAGLHFTTSERPAPSIHRTLHNFLSRPWSFLDCDALLAGLPSNTIKHLQMIQNAAARLVFNEPKRAHVTPLFISALAPGCSSHPVQDTDACIQNNHRLSTHLLPLTITNLHPLQKPEICEWASPRGTITERHKITFQNVFIHRSWLVEWSSHPIRNAVPENSSLPSSLDFLIFIIKENTPLLSFLNLSISS